MAALLRSFAVAVASSIAIKASALEWICSVPKRSMPVASHLDMNDLRQAYSGQPVLVGRQWVVVVMLPSNHPMTRRAFAELGLSAEVAERMASGSSLIDRGIRVVRSPEELISMVGSTFPSAGYAVSLPGASDVTICF